MVKIIKSSIFLFFLFLIGLIGGQVNVSSFLNTAENKVSSHDSVYTCLLGERGDREKETEPFLLKLSSKGFIGNYSNAISAYKLESNPGAKYLIYLDFDGETNITGWSGFKATAGASGYSANKIKRYWAEVSVDFIAFDVNITTNRSLFDNHLATNKGWCVIGTYNGGQTVWNGIAALSSFGTGKAVLARSLAGSLVASHELGHYLGLSHDGLNGGNAYYAGHGEFTPIMGNGYNSVTHWSKGGYSSANNTQDDIEIIRATLGTRVDDYLNSDPLTIVNELVSGVDNYGIINHVLDVDSFSFEIINNIHQIDLKIKPVFETKNLDVEAFIVDGQGNEIIRSNLIKSRVAKIHKILQPGKYFLIVKGGAELNPLNTGFSNYSSFGYYEISGTIELRPIDIVINGIEGLGVVCSDKVSGAVVKFENKGFQNVIKYKIETFVDATLLSTEVFDTPLVPSVETSYTLPDILNTGTNQVKVVITATSQTEKYTLDNTEIIEYTLDIGNKMRVYTNLTTFTGSDPLTWKVTDLSGTTILDGNNVDLIKNNLIVNQDFCLNDGCYKMEVTGGFKTCKAYSKYVIGGTYQNGAVAVYEGVIYKAKQWNKNVIPGNGGMWKKIGVCNEGVFSLGLKEVGINNVFFDVSSSQYSSPYIHKFCTSLNSDWNISITNIKGLGNQCGSINGSFVRIKNLGSNTITSYDIEVYLNNNLLKSETVTTSIPQNSTVNYILPNLTQLGTHNVKVIVSITGQTDSNISDNEKTISYTLTSGRDVHFYTDIENYDGSNPIIWKIKKNGNLITQSIDHEVIAGGDPLIQNFCLDEGCYEFSTQGVFDACSNYSTWNSSTMYTWGKKVVLDGIIYRVLLQGSNSKPPSSYWVKLGSCNMKSTYSVGVIDDFLNQQTIFDNQITGDFTTNFCTNSLSCTDPGTITLSSTGSEDICVPINKTITVSQTGTGTFDYSLDGTTWQANNSFTLTGAGTYSVQVRDQANPGDNACKKTSGNYTIVAIDKPNSPTFSTSTASLCAGETGINYVIGTVANTDDYTWSYTGNNTTFNPSTPTGTSATLDFANNATNGNVTVIANNACGSSTSATVAVTVHSAPSAPTVTTPIEYCKDGVASQLSATGTSLLWYTANTGGTGSTTAPTPSTAMVNSTSYFVSQSANNCESLRAEIVVITNALPTATLTTATIEICDDNTENATLHLSVSGGIANYTVVLSNGDNITLTSATGTHTVNNPATYTITSVTDSKTCTNTTTNSGTVTVSHRTNIDTSNYSVTCDGNDDVVVNFDITSGITSGHQVIVNSGAAITGSSFTSVPLAENTTHTLEVSDGTNCNPITISVKKSCSCPSVATLSLDDTDNKICPEDATDLVQIKVELTNGTGPYDFTVAGLTPVTGHPTNTYTTTVPVGTYSITTFHDSGELSGAGCDGTTSGSVTVINHAVPSIVFASANATICDNGTDQATININADANVTSVIYNDGTSDITLNTAPFSILTMNDDTYTLKSADDNNGCTTTLIGTSAVAYHPSFDTSNVSITCDPANDPVTSTFNYIISLEITGTAVTTVSGTAGTTSGNTWTSSPIDEASITNLSIIDDQSCKTITIANLQKTCSCPSTAAMSFSGSDKLCSGDMVAVDLIFTGTGDFDYIISDGTNTITGNTATTTASENLSVAGNYGLVFTDNGIINCTNVIGNALVVGSHTLPTASFDNASTTICDNSTDQATLNITTSAGVKSLVVNDGTNDQTLTTPFQITTSLDNTYTLKSVTDANCTEDVLGTSAINYQVNIDTSNYSVTCDGNDDIVVSFDITSGITSGHQVIVNSGAAITGSSFTSVPLAENTTHTLEVSDGTNCNPITISVKKSCSCPSVATLSLDDTDNKICPEDATDLVQIKVELTNGTGPYDFTVAGLTPVTGHPTNTYTTTVPVGTYSITTFHDSGELSGAGCDGTTSGSVTVINHAVPSIVFASANATICDNGTDQATININADANVTSVIYNDGTSDITLNTAPFSILTMNDDTYTLKSADDNNGCTTTLIGTSAVAYHPSFDTSNVSITCDPANDPVTSTFNYIISLEITGTAVTTVSGTAGTTSGNTWTSSPIDEASITNLSIIDDQSCKTITIANLQKTCSCPSTAAMSFSGSENKVCMQGGNPVGISLSFTGAGPFDYTIKKDNVNYTTGTSTTATELVDVTDAGVYTMSFVDQSVSCGAPVVTQLTVGTFPMPMASITSADQTLCDNGQDQATVSIILTAGSAPFTYIYNDGNTDQTLTATGLSDEIKTMTVGNYTLVSITDANGCVSTNVSGQTTVDNLAAPAPTMVDASFDICDGDNRVISMTSSHFGNTISWYKDGILLAGEDGLTYQVNNGGMYYATESNGVCPAVKTDSIDVKILAYPIVIAGEDKFEELGNTFIIDGASVSGIYTDLLWSGSNINLLDSPSNLNPTVNTSSLTNATTLVYTLTVGNDGCVNTDEIEIVTSVPFKTFNSFSPNGDGVNDTWTIQGMERYPSANVKIFDRWGQLVFESTGYQTPWDGTVNGKRTVPIGTYYYVIDLGGDNANSGYITVVK